MSQTPIHTVSQFQPGSIQADLAGQLAARQLHKEQLGDRITELAAHIHAATFRLLELIREFDVCEGWAGEGVLSCAHWLNWKCGMAIGVARERVRVAHALKDLPKISQTFRKGKISYSKVRAITRVATLENESYLLMISHYGTAAHVERLVTNYRSVKRGEALEKAHEQHLQRELRWFIDDDGYWVIRGRLPPDTGSLVQQVLEQIMKEQFQELRDVPAGISGTAVESTAGSKSGLTPELRRGLRPESAAGSTSGSTVNEIRPRPEEGETGNRSRSWPGPPIGGRRADALVRMAAGYSNSLKTRGQAENYLVHIHTDLETLKQDGTGAEAEIESGGIVCSETTRRIACDSAVVQWLDANGNGHNGQTQLQSLAIGRKSRTISPAIRRALQRRDGGCRFPGCTASHFVHAHHIQHWADGGETGMENLILLCTRHHHLVHEGGFGLQKLSCGKLQFTNPQGMLIPNIAGGRSSGNVDTLFRLNLDYGIQINPKTAQSRWTGEKMDDQLAVEGLLIRE